MSYLARSKIFGEQGRGKKRRDQRIRGSRKRYDLPEKNVGEWILDINTQIVDWREKTKR